MYDWILFFLFAKNKKRRIRKKKERKKNIKTTKGAIEYVT
jgi:hypothetical protein